MPRADASPSFFRDVATLSRKHAVPLTTMVLTLLLIVSGMFARSPVQDATTQGPAIEATFRRPLSYVLMAPVSNVLDTLTLLSLRQHIAVIVTLALLFAFWWWAFGRDIGSTAAPGRRIMRVAARIGVALVVLLGTYAAMAILPRPMAGIDVGQDLIAIDFHAHTKFSHDGRPDWTAEDVRAWHANAGFGAAYVSDHRTFDGAREAWPNNPKPVGEGTTLLPAIEVVWRGEHVNVLDADRFYRGLLNETLRDVDDQALLMASAVPNSEPVLIETVPGDLARMQAAKGAGTAGVRALEIIDGSPKGLGQGRRERARTVQLADSLDIALVAGSDHHGWGRAASGWTLMYLPQWRGTSPDVLSRAISMVLRKGGRGGTKVVERYVADTETGIKLPLTLPLVAWGMMRTMSNDERGVWLAWTIAFYLLWRLRESRRSPIEPAPAR